jgi:hypothetical protein
MTYYTEENLLGTRFANGVATNAPRVHSNQKGNKVMNSPIRKIAATALLALTAMIGNQASAIPISGAISFFGTVSVPAGTTVQTTSSVKFGFGPNDTVAVGATATGAYAGIGAFDPITAGVFDGGTFTFLPPTIPTTLIWSFTDGSTGLTYTFSLGGILTVNQTSGLYVSGWGDATISGSSSSYDDTAGFFELTSQGSNATVTFSSTTTVPDSGTTAMLIGVGLVGTALASRRFKKSSSSKSVS